MKGRSVPHSIRPPPIRASRARPGYGLQVRLDAMELPSAAAIGACCWHVISTSSWSWIGSGRAACRIHAREPAGSTFCRRWCAIADRSRQRVAIAPAVGSSRARWRSASADFALAEKNALYPLPGQSVGAQGSAVFPSAPALADLFGARFEVLLYDLTTPISSLRRPMTRTTNAATATAATSAATACRWSSH